MKKHLFVIVILLSSFSAISQIPEEAIRLGWRTQQGTARNQAIGGAMGSLGGDATALLVNPAGIAFFKTSDLVFSPGWQMLKNKSNFRGTPYSGEQRNKFKLGPTGLVTSGWDGEDKTSFGIAVTTTADFNQRLYYRGQNDYSSFAEPLADEFAASGQTIDGALNNNNISLPTRMGLYTYLVDTATIGGIQQVIARSENTSLLNQEHLSETTGGITEITFGVGHEFNRKFMLGGSLGIPIVKIKRDSYYKESDASGNLNNDFDYLAYHEQFKMTGAGFNFRIGAIYRPQEYVRIGLALHSPDILMVRESFRSGLATDLENLFGPGNGYDSVASSVFSGAEYLESRYTTYTPGRIILSGSYVFREVANVKQQKGFITADVEYVNYKWSRFGTADEENGFSKEYYEPFNEAIDAISRAAFNFRVGGELKFNILMARLGFAYYGSPYREKELKASKMNLSGGLGYRHKGIFVDLTYVHRIDKDVHFPYRVNAPRANTFASIKETGGNVLLTFGVKI